MAAATVERATRRLGETDGRMRRFGFLLLDQFPLLPVSGMMDVLRDAAYVTGRDEFFWCSLSLDGRPVEAMNGLRVTCDHAIAEVPTLDAVMVCAGLHGHLIEDRRLFAWLRRLQVSGVAIGAVATGTWILAKAGLLGGRRCTLHWEDIPAFRETHPLIEVVRDLYVFDGPIFTCSGGTGAIDMLLSVVRQDLGDDVAVAVARQIMHKALRTGSEAQPSLAQSVQPIRQVALRRALDLMQDSVEQPLPIAEIARRAGTSQKQIERLFANHFGTTPQLYYRGLRLDHARTLVRLTDLEIWRIATIVGFATRGYFTLCYRQRFGCSPSTDRKPPAQPSTLGD